MTEKEEMYMLEEIAEQAIEQLEKEKRSTYYKYQYFLDDAEKKINDVVREYCRGWISFDRASSEIERIMRWAL